MSQLRRRAPVRQKRSEIRHARNLAGDARTRLQLRDRLFPRIGRKLLQPQRDLVRLRIDLQNLDVNLVANGHDIKRFDAARIRHVGNVQKPIDTAQIDKRAEIHQAADRPAHHHAFLQTRERFLLRLFFTLFKNHAPVYDHILRSRIELGDAALDFLDDQLFKIRLFPCAAARSRHKRAHPNIDTQPAFDHFEHGP